MTEKMKKEWNKPELIVLVRSKPEEAVLLVCKNPPVKGPTVACNVGQPATCHLTAAS